MKNVKSDPLILTLVWASLFLGAGCDGRLMALGPLLSGVASAGMLYVTLRLGQKHS